MKSRMKITTLIVTLILGGFVNLYAQADFTTDEMMSYAKLMMHRTDSLHEVVRAMNTDLQNRMGSKQDVATAQEARYLNQMGQQMDRAILSMKGAFNQYYHLIEVQSKTRDQQKIKNLQFLQMHLLGVVSNLEDISLMMSQMQKSYKSKSVTSNQ